MKISKRDRNLILMICGLLFAFAMYYFVFLKLQDKTTAIEAQNVSLENVIAKLKELDKNREQYLADTETFKEKNAEIKTLFPVGMEEENDILFVDGLENGLNEYYVSSLGMPAAVAYELAYPAVEQISVDEMLNAPVTPVVAAEGETTDAESAVNGAALSTGTGYASCQLWYVPITTTYEANYLSLKQLVKAVTDHEDRKSIEEVSITYNEENGILSGSMLSNYYYLTGTEEIYEYPDVNGVSVGTSNPFRSVR
ncbi:MAG: hypothetical protein K2M46_08780 [Lachnospiraceae bacterium]|nr:hypothetical protein [Lachnospiraceae bacterium]